MQALIEVLEFKAAVKKPMKYRLVKNWGGDLSEVPKKSFMVYEKDEPLVVKTVLDEKKETKNVAVRGDVIITGPKKEQYVVKPSKFMATYNIVDEVATPRPMKRMVAKVGRGVWKAAGLGRVESIGFTAPWGEEMLLTPGDYLVKEDVGKYYRVEKKAFEETYKML